MEEGLNAVTLIGRLGKDPEVRFTQSNQAVMSLNLATTKTFFDNNSKERKSKTEWHSITVWGKRAEGLNKILSKGSRICVQGELQTRKWEDNSGTTRYKTEVVAQNVVLLGGGNGKSESTGRQESTGDTFNDQSDDYSASQPSDDDIPF